MNTGRLAYDPDRLPWLPNEQRPPPPASEPRADRRGKGVPWSVFVPWALVALLLIAGLSYWVGMRSMRGEPSLAPAAKAPTPGASITLPKPREPEPVRAPPVEAAPVAKTVTPEPPAPVPAAEPPRPPPRPPVAKRAAVSPAKAKAPSPTVRRTNTARSKAPPKKLQPWPATVSQGAAGRMVRIGTFGSSRQAKRAWSQLMRAYPGMQRLKAVVVPVRSLRNNQTYYRLQFGTTSQAHSAVLCQRMRMIGQPCVVIG